MGPQLFDTCCRQAHLQTHLSSLPAVTCDLSKVFALQSFPGVSTSQLWLLQAVFQQLTAVVDLSMSEL